MCTISFIPLKEKAIFTFNRDEHPNRKTPIYLHKKQLEQKIIYFPVDPKAGGTWFVADNTGNIALLFNGGLSAHKKQNNYTRSRGVLLLELFSSENIKEAFQQKDLYLIEPFSILLYEKKALNRLIWDGVTKMDFLLDAGQKHIFSSATIYTKEIQAARENWFSAYTSQTEVNERTIFHFHNNYNIQDKENGLVINRNDALQTLSISQAVLTDESISLLHLDREKQTIFTEKIAL